MADVGRPTVMTQEVIGKLDEAFAMGCTDKEACLYAGIHPSSLYDYQNEHPEFSERKETLKESPFLLARRTIYKSLNTVAAAQWFMERKRKDEFSQRVENTGKDGKDLLPIPILATMNVPTDNSDNQDSPATEADQGGTGGNISEQDNLDTPIVDSPSAERPDPNPDLDSVGVNPPSETRGDEGFQGNNEPAQLLEGQ